MRMRGLGVFVLMIWAVSVLLLLFVPVDPSFETSIFFSYSLTAFVGFFLASGNARLWVRWLLVGLNVLLIFIAHANPSRIEGLIIFGVLTMISAGFTYAIRMILAAVLGESSPRQRFTIFGLMLATAVTAVCLVALNALFAPREDTPVALIGVILIGLGFSAMAQCAPAWARTKLQAVIIGVIALTLAFAMSLVLYQVFQLMDGAPPSFEEILLPIWVMIGLMWLIIYPLWFGVYAVGWNLVGPGWKLGQQVEAKPTANAAEEDVDVLMEE